MNDLQVVLGMATLMREESLTAGDVLVLARMMEEGSLIMTECAQSMGGSTAAATGVVDKLERRHLVERLRTSGDRRKVRVVLTEAGEVLVERMRSLVRRLERGGREVAA